MNQPKHPDIEVTLTGQDGNVFNLMGIVSKALPAHEVYEFRADVMSAQSYDEALRKMMEWVVVH
jgi:hypothetical protein